MYIGQVVGYHERMIGFVYILTCANGRYYIGSTEDTSRRLAEHQSGRVRSTRNVLPVEMIFYQTYASVADARRVEYKLKRLKNKSILEQIIRDRIIRMGP